MRARVSEVYLRRAPGVVLSAAWLRAGYLLQRDAARALGTTEPALSEWMNGRVVMTPYWISRAASVFRMTPDEALGLVVTSAMLERARVLLRGVERPHPTDGPCA